MAMTPHRYIAIFYPFQNETIIPIAYPDGIWVSFVFAGIVKVGLRMQIFSISASDVLELASYVFSKKNQHKGSKNFLNTVQDFRKKVQFSAIFLFPALFIIYNTQKTTPYRLLYKTRLADCATPAQKDKKELHCKQCK